MATIVKGKICLCQTSLNNWTPEKVNGVLFYDRYQEFLRLFSSKIPEVNFEQCFAQPVYNDESKDVEWFIVPMDEYPSTLKEIPESFAEAEKQRIINAVKKASKKLSDNDLKYINPILMTLLSDKVDDITYHCNGKVVFAVWGMNLKKGKEIREVITDDIKDHRIHHVTYKVKGKGNLSFTDIVRRHGHELQGETDIPIFTPAAGYRAKEWFPESPSGVPVNGPLEFTIVFEKEAGDVPAVAEGTEESAGIAAEPLTEPEKPEDEVIEEPKPEEPKPEDSKYYDVKFTSDNRGVIRGQAEYRKKEGDRVLQAEVPYVEPREGYRFIGWTMNPIDYIVNGDTVFTAQYEPIEPVDEVVEERVAHGPLGWFSGCLSWLLAALLLALIAFLLWFLLGKHNINFCGGCDCGCDKVVVDPEEKEDPDDEEVKVLKCEEAQQAQGQDVDYHGAFEMGQQSGDFWLHYNNYGVADRIIVYDGRDSNSKIIYDPGYEAMYDMKDVRLHFTKGWVYVEVLKNRDPEGWSTAWEFTVDCPD